MYFLSHSIAVLAISILSITLEINVIRLNCSCSIHVRVCNLFPVQNILQSIEEFIWDYCRDFLRLDIVPGRVLMVNGQHHKTDIVNCDVLLPLDCRPQRWSCCWRWQSCGDEHSVQLQWVAAGCRQWWLQCGVRDDADYWQGCIWLCETGAPTSWSTAGQLSIQLHHCKEWGGTEMVQVTPLRRTLASSA